MTTTLIADRPVEVDAEGFLTHTDDWDEQLAAAIARESGIPGIDPVTGWSSTSCATATSQPARHPRSAPLGKESGVPVKELYQLFPKGPAKLAARIGGIPKPRGCI